MSFFKVPLLACIAVVMCCAQPEPTGVPKSKEPKLTLAEKGLKIAIDKVTPSLLAPSTANFPVETVTTSQAEDFEGIDGKVLKRWSVKGGVDAHNRFGAMIRNEWVVLFSDEHGDQLIEVTLGDGVVFREPGYAKAVTAVEIRKMFQTEIARVKSEIEFYERLQKKRPDTHLVERLVELRKELAGYETDLSSLK